MSRHSDINRQLQELTIGVARHLEMASAGSGGSLRVVSLELDWVFDQGQGGGSCWLIWPHSIETRPDAGRPFGRTPQGDAWESRFEEGKSRDRDGKESEDGGGVDSALYARARAAEAARQEDAVAKRRYESLCRQAEGDGWRGRVLVADGDVNVAL